MVMKVSTTRVYLVGVRPAIWLLAGTFPCATGSLMRSVPSYFPLLFFCSLTLSVISHLIICDAT